MHLPPGKLGEHGAGGRLVAQGQLVLAQVGELQVQAIVVAGAEPVVVLAAVSGPEAQIELYRQLQMVHALVIAEQQVQLAEGAAVLPDRQVGRDQLQVGRLAQRVLPEPFVVQPQAPIAALRQPGLEDRRLGILAQQPVGQQPRLAVPAACAQGVTLAGRCFAQQGRRQQRPGEITHLRMAKDAGQLGKTDRVHVSSIAVGLPPVRRFADNPVPLNTRA